LERDEGGEAEQRQAGDGRELLGDADVAGAGGDADADPDRPECEEGVKRIWASSCGGWKTTVLTTWAAPKRTLIRTTR
jgi:hypothetical protein